MKKDVLFAVKWALLTTAAVFALAMLFTSCSPKVIYVPEYHTEYKTKTDSVYLKDSVFLKDSVIIKQSGDTIFVDRWHNIYKEVFKDKIIVDSIIKTDSIKVPYPVEKQLSKWQRAKVDWGGWAMFIVVIIILILFIYPRWKRGRSVS